MDPAAILTAIAAVIGAIGGIVAAVLSYRAKTRVDKVVRDLTIVDGNVVELGDRVDGRLSELLKTTQALARAEGVASGEQSQRDRAAEAQL